MVMEKQIVVFSDVHYSANWDAIETRFKHHAAPLGGYLNPNRELRRFVERMNASSRVDVVINNGDALDYHFSEYATVTGLLKNGANCRRATNRDLFNNEIEKLQKSYFAIPGNHDYRTEAYNYAFWGTDHVNLGRMKRIKYKHHIGHHRFRGPFELAAITVNEKKFDPLAACRHYRKRDDREIGRFHCIFLDTGCDAFARPSNFLKCLKTIFRTKRLFFDSDGLKQQDLDHVSRVLSATARKKDILIFQHAPLINPRISAPHAVYRLSVDSFRESTLKQKIAHHTIVNGGGRLLDILQRSDHNLIIISSHIHNSKYFLIDKISLTAEEVTNREFNREKDNPGYIKQVTTLPLGGIYPDVGGFKTGFLTISSTGFEETVIHNFNGRCALPLHAQQ